MQVHEKEWPRRLDVYNKEFRYALISREISVPQVITGFICGYLGIITQELGQLNPIIRTGTGLAPKANKGDLPLFHEVYSNPNNLTDLVERDIGLEPKERARLRRLGNALAYYRSGHNPDNKWMEVHEKIPNVKGAAYHELHDFLSYIIHANAPDPRLGYIKCYQALSRLFALPQMDFYNLSPRQIEIAIHKAERDEPDNIEHKSFHFDRRRAVFLNETNTVIVIGGSPNSGKSTFAARLYKTMSTLVTECEHDGILAAGELKISLCDLGLPSPTSSYIIQGKSAIRSEKSQWKPELVTHAQELLHGQRKVSNIIIADLPGGIPDRITQELAVGADYSILIDKHLPKGGGVWQDFLLDARLPNYLVAAHTRLEQGRVSGIRSFESGARGNKINFLRGRVVNLDRTLADDPFIRFTAHTLLFDYLPGAIIKNLGYHSRIHTTLGLE